MLGFETQERRPISCEGVMESHDRHYQRRLDVLSIAGVLDGIRGLRGHLQAVGKKPRNDIHDYITS